MYRRCGVTQEQVLHLLALQGKVPGLRERDLEGGRDRTKIRRRLGGCLKENLMGKLRFNLEVVSGEMMLENRFLALAEKLMESGQYGKIKERLKDRFLSSLSGSEVGAFRRPWRSNRETLKIASLISLLGYPFAPNHELISVH